MEEKQAKRKQVAYSKELGELVCYLISTNTGSLDQLYNQYPDLPSRNTVNNWRVSHPEFADKYLEAKKLQSHLLIDEIIDIIDDPANLETECLAWAKERIKTRQWIASRLLQKIYGDKQMIEATVKHEDDLEKLK